MFGTCDLSGKKPCKSNENINQPIPPKTKLLMVGMKECPNCQMQEKAIDGRIDPKFELEKVYDDNPKYNELSEKYDIDQVPTFIIDDKKCILDGDEDNFFLNCNEDIVEIQSPED